MFDTIAKGAKTFILIVLISAIAAAILTVYIWTQPTFIEMIAQGNYWFIFSTFLSCWLLASILSWVIVAIATKRPKSGSVPSTIAD